MTEETVGTPSKYPTIERLADIRQTTTGYQPSVLIAEAVICWREVVALTAERESIIEECARVCEGDDEGNPDEWDWHVKDYARAIRALKASQPTAKEEHRKQRDELAEALAELDAAKLALAEQIDRLMLEYCPDEMSAEQVENWGAHQRAAPSELEIDVTAALAAKSSEPK